MHVEWHLQSFTFRQRQEAAQPGLKGAVCAEPHHGLAVASLSNIAIVGGVSLCTDIRKMTRSTLSNISKKKC